MLTNVMQFSDLELLGRHLLANKRFLSAVIKCQHLTTCIYSKTVRTRSKKWDQQFLCFHQMGNVRNEVDTFSSLHFGLVYPRNVLLWNVLLDEYVEANLGNLYHIMTRLWGHKSQGCASLPKPSLVMAALHSCLLKFFWTHSSPTIKLPIIR